MDFLHFKAAVGGHGFCICLAGGRGDGGDMDFCYTLRRRLGGLCKRRDGGTGGRHVSWFVKASIKKVIGNH